jgi:hypothetical protein
LGFPSPDDFSLDARICGAHPAFRVPNISLEQQMLDVVMINNQRNDQAQWQVSQKIRFFHPYRVNSACIHSFFYAGRHFFGLRTHDRIWTACNKRSKSAKDIHRS